ncbi:MAG: hypothetical protein GY894_02095 [Planctomycetes bacterium]|nr:hypothetical protein [Planctomycetota bacterium]
MRGLPSIRLTRSATGRCSLTFAQHSQCIDAASTLRLTLLEEGWGPIIGGSYTVSLLSAAGEAVVLAEIDEHDVLDKQTIDHIADALKQVAEAVHCTLQIQDHR